MDDHDEWIPVERAADILRLSDRSVQRYGSGRNPRLRTKQYTGSKRIFYFLSDVEELAKELGAAKRPVPPPRQTKPEMVPAGELLNYLRQKDQEIDQREREIRELIAQQAKLEAELERRALPGQVEEIEDKLTSAENELTQIRTERNELQKQVQSLRSRTYIFITLIIIATLIAIGLSITLIIQF